jgi:HEAT repeat protein
MSNCCFRGVTASILTAGFALVSLFTFDEPTTVAQAEQNGDEPRREEKKNGPPLAQADDARDRLRRHDDSLLRESGVALDTAGLLACIRENESPGDARDVPALIKKLGTDDFAAREEASAQLVRTGSRAVQALRDATQSKDPEVAQRAQKCWDAIERRLNLTYAAIRQLGRAESVGALRSLLRSKDPTARQVSAEVLKGLGEKARAAVAELIEALSDPVAEVRETAYGTVPWVADGEAVPSLLRVAKSGPTETRVLALQLLSSTDAVALASGGGREG